MRWLTACTKSATSCSNLLSTWWPPHFHMTTVAFQFPSLFRRNFESGWFQIDWESTLWTLCWTKKIKFDQKCEISFENSPITITSRSKFDSTASCFSKSWINCWDLQCIWIKSNSPRNWLFLVKNGYTQCTLKFCFSFWCTLKLHFFGETIRNLTVHWVYFTISYMDLLVKCFSSFGIWWSFEVVLSNFSWAFSMIF